MLKKYNNSSKCNDMGFMVSMMVTHSWFKLTDMPLFTMCLVACIQTSYFEVFDQKYQVPVPCVDVTCVGRCFV